MIATLTPRPPATRRAERGGFLRTLHAEWTKFRTVRGWVLAVAGALLVLGYTTAEAVFLAWLFNWSISGATGIVFFSCATLVAAAYNLFACDWIAEKLE